MQQSDSKSATEGDLETGQDEQALLLGHAADDGSSTALPTNSVFASLSNNRSVWIASAAARPLLMLLLGVALGLLLSSAFGDDHAPARPAPAAAFGPDDSDREGRTGSERSSPLQPGSSEEYGLLPGALASADTVSVSSASSQSCVSTASTCSASCSSCPSASSSCCSCASAPLSNYSIIAPWASRWPVSSVPDMRGAVLSFFAKDFDSSVFSKLQIDLRQHFPFNEENLLLPFADHLDFILLYRKWPSDVQEGLLRFLRDGMQWTLVPEDELTIWPRLAERANRTAGVRLSPLSKGREFVTQRGLRVLVYPLGLNLPQFIIDGQMELLDPRPGWHRCHGHASTLDYELWSGAVWNWPVMAQPLLSAYDYVMKLDIDVRWKARPPLSPFQHMQQRQCVWLHTQFTTKREDCLKDAETSARQWAAQRNYTPASDDTDWFNLRSGYFYGNAVGGWLGYLKSPDTLSLMRHLWENEEYPGYFKHRWSDQPVWSVLLGMWYNITDQAVRRGGDSSSHICALTNWRTKYFVHSSHMRRL